MKKSILIFAMVLSTLSIKAQDIVVTDSMAMDSIAITDTINIALIVDDMENAVIHQDSLIRQLMIDKRMGIQRGQVQVNGFRV